MSCFSNHGVELRCETFGAAPPDRIPVLLIHGNTSTGRTEWEGVVERMAHERCLIVPEWGHGHSPLVVPPGAFRELAEDMAAQVRGLGFEAVHAVGSGAGACVALHLLRTCPGLVRTCLVDMGAEEGEGLESLELSSLACPTLVVDSGASGPGAPSTRGALLAAQIPEAELWPCQGDGLPAHKAALRDWCARVARFWTWRGDAVSERLHHHRCARFPDSRQGPFEVRAENGHLTGTVLDQALLVEASSIAGLPADGVQVLLADDTPWALVQCPVEDLRREPNRLTERMSQALQGEAVRILQSGVDWSRIRMERDGYMGWIHTHALHRCDPDRARQWLLACNARVVACLADARGEDDRPAWKLPFSTKVRVVKTAGPTSWIQVPDGSTWKLSSEDLEPIGEPRTPGPSEISRALTLFRRFLGTPYLWGGRTPFGFDCSGLAGTFYDFLGSVLPRDADQQFAMGAAFEGPCLPGDLLFFGELQAGTPGLPASGYARHARITHVAISLGGDDFIHADGHQVACNSLDPQSPLFDAWSSENFRGARRYLPLASA